MQIQSGGTVPIRFVQAFWWDMHVDCPPDGKNVLVDLVELWDGSAGGGRVQEPGALVIHVQHLYTGKYQKGNRI